MKIIISSFVAGVVWIASAGAETNTPVGEVLDVLRTHYVDREKLSEPALGAATLAGILEALGRGVTILSKESADGRAVIASGSLALTNGFPLGAASGPVARAEVIEPNIGYLRIFDLTAAAVPALDAELRKFREAKVEGYILDLRFADGNDWDAAAAVASRFFADERDLFVLQRAERDGRVFRTTRSDPAVAPASGVPLLLLVNGQTRGAAEVLVGALRGQERGIVVGSLTAGSAAAWEDVPLRDGRVLRVATAKIVLHVAPGASVIESNIFPHGIAPDIFVPLAPTVEQDVVLNAATNVTLTVSLQPRVTKKRMSEAELMKLFRGQATDATEAEEPAAEEGEIQRVRDVVLQRAVDVLKGIRVLLSWR